MAAVEGIVILLILAGLAATVWAIVDLVQRPPEQFPSRSRAGGSDKTGWIIGLVVGWLFGLGWAVAIAYLVVVRGKMGPVVRGAQPPDVQPPGVPPA